MNPLKSFLEKFKKLESDDAKRKEWFVRCAAQCGVSLAMNECVFKGDEVAVTTAPVKKNELFIKKDRILAAYNKGGLPPLTAIR